MEPAKDPPEPAGVRTWPSRVWTFYLDASDAEGWGGKVIVAFWGVVILVGVLVGIYAIAISV